METGKAPTQRNAEVILVTPVTRWRRDVEQFAPDRQAELAQESARFEAKRAHRQYDVVDPDNRLVAGELERRWNERLAVVRQREEAVAALRASRKHEALGPEQRQEYLALGADLERAWNDERATPESRKRHRAGAARGGRCERRG